MTPKRILVLEDHPELREQTRLTLTDAGYTAIAAANGAEAIALAHKAPFDLLVADIFLPDSSGIEVFHQIRAFRPDIAGLVITGLSSWEVAANALNAGFVGFLVKPVVPEQLLAAVVSALEQERLRRENARLRSVVPLYELSHTFMGSVPLGELLNQIVTVAQRETQAHVVSLMLLEPDVQTLRIAAAAGLPGHIVESEKLLLGEGIAGRVAQRGEPLIVSEQMPLDAEIRPLMNNPEILSALSLPLRVRGSIIGVLNLARLHGSDPFTNGDLELATVFAGQTAMAIDQARLFDQLKELNQITQNLARAIDLSEAIHILRTAPEKLVHARETIVWLVEGTLQPAIVHALGLEQQLVLVPRERIISGLQTGKQADWINVPMQHSEKMIGALLVHLPSTKPLSEEAHDALRTLANTASAVIESHSLRAREATGFHEVDEAMRADLNLQELIQRLLNEMIKTCEAEGGAIFLWNESRHDVEPWVNVHLEDGIDLAREIIRDGHASVAADATQARSIIGAPMIVRQLTQGVVVLARPLISGAFSKRQLDLLATFSSTAALAIRNAQLYSRSEERAIVEERTRIAREIHDGLAQDLSYLVLKIGAAQKLASQGKERDLRKELAEISDQLRSDIREVRRTIFALRPLDIESEGFLPALTRFVKDFGQTNEIETELDLIGNATHLPPKLEIALFRLTQESLNNIRKHAQAKHVRVELTIAEGHSATLLVRDDGNGFDWDQAMQSAHVRGSVGLVQMRERAERAGGHFSIETKPGKGTQIQVELPIREV